MNKNRSSLQFPIIAPSVLASDFGNIRNEIAKIYNAGARWFHFDVMDGSFVPPITFGDQLVASVRKEFDAYFDVHLMVENPEQHISVFKEAGANQLTVHYETCRHLHHVIEQIHKHDMDAGVVINPATPVSVLTDIISSVEMVLIMSVNPGWGGQVFIPHTYHKFRELRNLCESRQVSPLIQVDGGVGLSNAGKIALAGVDVLVAGSSIYNADHPARAYQELSDQVTQTQSA